jgi:hypothetical protein
MFTKNLFARKKLYKKTSFFGHAFFFIEEKVSLEFRAYDLDFLHATFIYV